MSRPTPRSSSRRADGGGEGGRGDSTLVDRGLRHPVPGPWTSLLDRLPPRVQVGCGLYTTGAPSQDTVLKISGPLLPYLSKLLHEKGRLTVKHRELVVQGWRVGVGDHY